MTRDRRPTDTLPHAPTAPLEPTEAPIRPVVPPSGPKPGPSATAATKSSSNQPSNPGVITRRGPGAVSAQRAAQPAPVSGQRAAQQPVSGQRAAPIPPSTPGSFPPGSPSSPGSFPPGPPSSPSDSAADSMASTDRRLPTDPRLAATQAPFMSYRALIAPTELPTDPEPAPPGGFERGFDVVPGQMIGRFMVRERIGEGGMGVVFAGHDADLGRPVAIKVVRSDADHPAYRARLLREAQAMARLEHPHIARIYEIGNHSGRVFVAMELVDGVTLTAWLRAESRSWREVVVMFSQIGSGLAAVHRAGLVHRDFKPDNVLVDRNGRARVVDFGLARVAIDTASSTMSPELAASLTRSGMMLGTPGYIAPEQQFGGMVDARADQYSFCVALREALLGSRSVTTDDPRWQVVPRWLRAIVSRGLSYDPDERYPSMTELLGELDRGGPGRGRVIGGVVAAVLLAGGVAGAIVMTHGSSPPSGDQTAESADRTVGSADRTVGSAGRTVPAQSIVVAGADQRVPDSPDAAIVRTTPLDAAIARTTLPDAAIARTTPADATIARTTPPDASSRSTDAAVIVASDDDRQHGNPYGSGNPYDDKNKPAADKSSSSGGADKTGGGSAKPPPPAPAPTRHSFDPAHRAATLSVFTQLGYRGVTFGADLADDEQDAVGKIASISPDDLLEKGKLQWALGEVQRKRGNCESAMATYLASRKTLAEFNAKNRHENKMWTWFSFDVFDTGLCDFELGRVDDAIRDLDGALTTSFGMGELVHGELLVAIGILEYETHDPKRGKETILTGARAGDAKLRTLVEAWAKAVGMSLP